MSTIKSSDEHLTINADGSGKEIKFQCNGTEVAKIDSTGFVGAGSSSTGIEITAADSFVAGDLGFLDSNGQAEHSVLRGSAVGTPMSFTGDPEYGLGISISEDEERLLQAYSVGGNAYLVVIHRSADNVLSKGTPVAIGDGEISSFIQDKYNPNKFYIILRDGDGNNDDYVNYLQCGEVSSVGAISISTAVTVPITGASQSAMDVFADGTLYVAGTNGTSGKIHVRLYTVNDLSLSLLSSYTLSNARYQSHAVITLLIAPSNHYVGAEHVIIVCDERDEWYYSTSSSSYLSRTTRFSNGYYSLSSHVLDLDFRSNVRSYVQIGNDEAILLCNNRGQYQTFNTSSSQLGPLVDGLSGSWKDWHCMVIHDKYTNDTVVLSYEHFPQEVGMGWETGQLLVRSLNLGSSGYHTLTESVMTDVKITSVYKDGITVPTKEGYVVFGAYAEDVMMNNPTLRVVFINKGNKHRFVGIAKTSVSVGETLELNTTGEVNDAQTGLVAGEDYRVSSSTGVLEISYSANDRIGTALSNTEILIG